jgi:hypothetical protein
MWQWLTANAAQLSVVVTFAYTLLTGLVVFLMWRSNRQMRRSIAQSAAAEEAQSRPYVIVEFVRQRGGFVSFRISNFGRSSAKHIRAVSDPEIKPVRGAGSVTTVGSIPEFIGLFRHSIPYLAPKQQLQALIGHYSGIRASYPELHFKISIQYNGIGGPFSETVELSLKPTDEALHLTDYEVGKELHEIHETLKQIASKLET